MAPQPSRATALRFLAAGGSGLAVGLAFPPVDAMPLLPLGVAGLILACRGVGLRSAALLGGVFGVPFLLVLMPWLRVIGTDAWIVVAVLEALFYAALGVALALVTRLPGWPLWAAAAWVAAELARSTVPFGGLPWGRLAFGMVESPFAGYARLGGVALVTAMVALSANLAVWGFLRWWDRRRVLPAVGGLAAAAAVVAGGQLIPLGLSGADGSAVVAVVQGNVPDRSTDASTERRSVLANHATATSQLARRVEAGELPAPDLVIWPENSTDIDPYTDQAVQDTISAAVADIAVPTLVGAVVDGPVPNQAQNLGIVWDPATGPGKRYVKRHPVPFGEYVPFRALLTRYIDRLEAIPRDFAAGAAPGVLSLAGVTLGDLICFEVAYDGLVRDVVFGGAQLVVVQTNNATYLGTGQLAQQWAISRLRAIETGRTVVVAATNGISGFATADGRVLERSVPDTRDVLVQTVPLATSVSPGVRAGAWVEGLLAAIGVGAAVAAAALARRPRTVKAWRTSR